ncbi:MAG: hypothetical protein Q8R28_06670, partial [Dehalococcoidia bacterium]|nr:hypothetical protein [Dehalococcoidia bacterium]
VSGLVPSGASYTSNSANQGGVLQGNQIVWAVPQVAAKGQAVLTYKVSATGPSVGLNHAWIHWTAPTDGTAMSAEVAADYQYIKVKGVNTRVDHVKLPDGKVALTTTSGAGHQENEIVTSGLPNVGVGEYVFLEGAEADNAEQKVTAWSWSLVSAPLLSGTALSSTDKEETSLIPDRPGQYLVALDITNAKGEVGRSTLTVVAGDYAGISLCASCHDGSVDGAANTYATFMETGHAIKVEKTWDSYSATSDYCIRCHTLGYNEQANNGGMDDAARASGWTPKQGSVLAWLKKSWTLEQVKGDPNMSRTINITCENCHGPGGTSHTGTLSYDPAVCGQCHPQPQQWQYAKHTVIAADHMANNAGCAKCHTGQGFVEQMVRGEASVLPDGATPTKPANVPSPEQQSGITCATCHDPHSPTVPSADGSYVKSNQLRVHGKVTAPMGWSADAGEAATCVSCHADNRTPQNLKDFVAGTRTRGTHENTQADVFYGKGIYDYDGKLTTTNSFHTTLKDACVTCHMAPNPTVGPGPDGQLGTRDDEKALSVGGHSWNMAAEWNGKTVENTAACATCHANTTTFDRPAAGDYDGNGKVEGIQTEVKGLMAKLAALLPKDDAGKVLNYPVDTTNSTEAQRKAIWNYKVIEIDASNGVHNTAFTVQVLQKTYKELTGNNVPGATLR